MGKHCHVVWNVEWINAKIIKIQNIVAFIGRQSANQNTTTDQKQVAAMEGSMEGIFDKQDEWWKRDAIILGVL